MKILCIYGTRPEAIKMAPLVKALKESPFFQVATLTTGQHIELVKSINSLFGVSPEFSENIFEPGQSVNEILSKSLVCISKSIETYNPEIVIVQGDTTTAMGGAIAAFNARKLVVHVEAGLRTKNLDFPFPEEFNRRVISLCTRVHLAATPAGKHNLISEGFSAEDIFITGNTVIDSAKFVEENLEKISHESAITEFCSASKEFILVTMHRRESWGQPMEQIFEAILQISETFNDIDILFPVHPNPVVKSLATKILGNAKNITLTPPLEYVDMIRVISKCKFVITDSGGIQEEAPFFNKPVLIVRNETERVEGIESGCSRLISTNYQIIVEEVSKLIENEELYASMSSAVNSYGDANAVKRIRNILEWYFGFSELRPIEFVRK